MRERAETRKKQKGFLGNRPSSSAGGINFCHPKHDFQACEKTFALTVKIPSVEVSYYIAPDTRRRLSQELEINTPSLGMTK